MKVLILGASGLVGHKLFEELSYEYDVYGTYFSKREKYLAYDNMYFLDLFKVDEFKFLLNKTNPDVIISCLRGDFNQQLIIHKVAADFIVNKPNGKIIYLSTANVFDKLDKLPHDESHAPSSQSTYGNFKIKCETMLKEALTNRVIIIKVPFIWSKTSPRLIDIISKINNKEKIHMYSNLYTNHTTDIQIAIYIKEILKGNISGTIHIGTNEVINYLTFIKNIITALNLPMPEFEVEDLPYNTYLAVITNRPLPHELFINNDSIITYLSE